MKNFKNIIIVLVFLIVSLLNVILLIINISNINKTEQTLQYIASDEVSKGIESPKFIGKTLSQYSGDVKAISISKACYIFATEILPRYKKECTNNKTMDNFYDSHAGDIFILTGIENKEDFSNLIDKTKNLDENLIFENYRFDLSKTSIDDNSITAILYIKYKYCDEIMINVKIYNNVYNDRSSICFSANKSEERK